MRDYLSMDCVPSNEPTAQVGEEDYMAKSVAEYKRMKAALLSLFGEPPGWAEIKMGRNSHDFGEYIDLRLYFDNENEEESAWAYAIEAGWPETWEEAEAQLPKPTEEPVPA